MRTVKLLPILVLALAKVNYFHPNNQAKTINNRRFLSTQAVNLLIENPSRKITRHSSFFGQINFVPKPSLLSVILR
jgi:hypothetical protein